MSDSSTKTYVYDNIEVKLTGRNAEKRIESKGSSRRAASVKVDTLHEITPAGSIAASWKKWVRMSDLYEIEDE